ncbi:radical SAM protein [Lentzea sp. NPDC060358]|uniref:radical SAM protein n=1 Tax=Lentzea sp. NPDC060358 TaxID=3347103 RepID=UPI00364D0BD9
MKSTERRLVVLSSSDIPDEMEPLVHACEDCACPASGERIRRTLPVLADESVIRATSTLEIPVDDEHSALFNPEGNGGVVVVNTTGRELLARLTEATPIEDLVSAGTEPAVVEEALRTLVAFDIVHPAGRPPAPEFGDSTELTAWLHVTNKCNLRCPYCYVHKSDSSMDDDTARKSVDALVTSALRNGFRSLRLKYAGGEASLNSDVLLGLHEHARNRCAEAGIGLSAVLLSNGVAIAPRLAADLKRLGIRVMISLDGLGAAHDAQRPTLGGKPSSARVIRTIERLVAEGLAPHISITITSRNLDGVPDVVRFAVERSLTFSLNFFRDNDCSTSFQDLQFEEQAMIDGLTRAFTVVEERLPRWSLLGSVLDRGQLLSPRRRSCGVGDDYVVVDQYGNLAQCHMDLSSTVGRIGVDDPVQSIRRAPAGIRNLLAEEKNGCRECSWRNWCAGGCSVATFRATGRFDLRSPNCNIYRAIYPQAIRLEGLRILRYATGTDPSKAVSIPEADVQTRT